ncbi:hypothetical protein KAU33_15665 [Candidatus Dependentiae bacterium]|nr:hypothetical protein [Candidatus Dependentiae bacterium]
MIEQEKMEWAAEQIGLWIDNDRPFYNRKIRIFESLEKKKDKGIYDPLKALKAFNYLTTDVRRQLNREEKENITDMIGTTMPPAASTIVDEELRMEFEAWYTEEKELRAS